MPSVGLREVVGAGAGALAIGVGAPLIVGAVGFGAGGIAAGSLAASFMSTAYVSQIGLGALATAQSIGAAGVATSSIVAGGSVGVGIAHASRHLQNWIRGRNASGGEAEEEERPGPDGEEEPNGKADEEHGGQNPVNAETEMKMSGEGARSTDNPMAHTERVIEGEEIKEANSREGEKDENLVGKVIYGKVLE